MGHHRVGVGCSARMVLICHVYTCFGIGWRRLLRERQDLACFSAAVMSFMPALCVGSLPESSACSRPPGITLLLPLPSCLHPLAPPLSSQGPNAAQQVADFKLGSVWKLLIGSYEALRKHGADLAGTADLLVCDEGHRLKAAGGNKTIAALLALGCGRRVVLTGTPVQNNMEVGGGARGRGWT